jgi:hypothetical protein
MRFIICSPHKSLSIASLKHIFTCPLRTSGRIYGCHNHYSTMWLYDFMTQIEWMILWFYQVESMSFWILNLWSYSVRSYRRGSFSIQNHDSDNFEWVASFKHILSRCLSWTCNSQPLWQSRLWFHPHVGYMKSSFWCKPMEIYLTTHRKTRHIDHV